MSWFKCKHPATDLIVDRLPNTVEQKDADFDRVTVHLYCARCRTKVDIRCSTFRNGADRFLHQLHEVVSR